MPLSMSNTGESQIIKKIGGKEEIAGNMIVNVKGARVAIGKDMANKIMV